MLKNYQNTFQFHTQNRYSIPHNGSSYCDLGSWTLTWEKLRAANMEITSRKGTVLKSDSPPPNRRTVLRDLPASSSSYASRKSRRECSLSLRPSSALVIRELAFQPATLHSARLPKGTPKSVMAAHSSPYARQDNLGLPPPITLSRSGRAPEHLRPFRH